MNPNPARFLEYRPWHGSKNPWWFGALAVARESLQGLLKRKIFWLIYLAGLLAFLFYFFGQYIFFWLADLQSEEMVRVGGFGRANPNDMLQFLRNALKMDGSPDTFRNFFALESRALLILLILAGVSLLGEDLLQGSLSFFASRRKGLTNYLLGKFFAASVMVHLLLTLPALVLFLEICILDSWGYLWNNMRLLFGIFGYALLVNLGLVLPMFVSAALFRGTLNLILFWSGMFFLVPALVLVLVERLKFGISWRILDYWHCLERLGEKSLGAHSPIAPPGVDISINPWLSALAVSVVCITSLAILYRLYFHGSFANEG